MSLSVANAIKEATTTYNADRTENTNLLASTMGHTEAGVMLAQKSGSNAAGEC